MLKNTGSRITFYMLVFPSCFLFLGNLFHVLGCSLLGNVLLLLS